MNEQLQSWIWVDDAVYPNEQTTFLCHASDRTNSTYAVAEFTRTFAYDKPVESVRITVCGDTSFGCGSMSSLSEWVLSAAVVIFWRTVRCRRCIITPMKFRFVRMHFAFLRKYSFHRSCFLIIRAGTADFAL